MDGRAARRALGVPFADRVFPIGPSDQVANLMCAGHRGTDLCADVCCEPADLSRQIERTEAAIAGTHQPTRTQTTGRRRGHCWFVATLSVKRRTFGLALIFIQRRRNLWALT